MSGLQGRPGPGRPRRRRVVGTVISLSADDELARKLRGNARTACDFVMRRTGATLPGYGRVDVRKLLRHLRIGERQLYRIRARIAPFVQTRVIGGKLIAWSLMGARARASQGRFEQWWQALRALEVLSPHAPFLREVRAWLVETENRARSLIPEQSPVSTDVDRRDPHESGAWPIASPVSPVASEVIPQRYRVSEAPLTTVERAVGDAIGFWDASPAFSRGFWGVEPLTKMSPRVTPFSEQFRVSASHCHGTKQGREIQDWNDLFSAAPASSEIESPPPSGSARGGVEGSGGEHESPAPPLSDTWTADHGVDQGSVAPPPSQTRLKATRKGSIMTREESLAALAAIEAGELELPAEPGTPLRRPDAPTKPPPEPEVPTLERALADAAKPPARGLAKGKGDRATLRAFAVAFVAAMQRVRPEWKYPRGEDSDAGLREVFHAHCRERSLLGMQRWVELNATRFAHDERADGHPPKRWPLFLRVEKAHEPPPPLEPEIRGWRRDGYVDGGPLAALDAIEGPVLRKAL